MRVVHFIICFFPKPTGATHAAVRLAKALRETGVEQEFIVHDFDSRWRQGGVYGNFPVRSFFLVESGKFKKLKGLFSLSFYLLRRRREFDVFHIHGGGYVNFFLSWWVKKLTGKKVVLKITSDGWDTPDGAGKEKYGWLVKWFYRRIDGVVAMTFSQEVKVKAWGYAGLTATIPNGVDYNKYHPVDAETKLSLREKLGIPLEDAVLTYVGWLGYRKGTDVLLKVWAMLRQRFGKVTLLLIGNYMNFLHDENFAEFLKKHHIDVALLQSKQLITTGFANNVHEYLQASDIFVFPSRKEGFGTVQTEAMACGLPCVVNDLPGISCDIYPDESVGFRVKDNNVDEYVRIVSDWIEYPEKRDAIGKAARQRVVDYFSLESVGARYLDFYSLLLKNASD